MLNLLKTIIVLVCITGCKLGTDEYTAKIEEHRKSIDEIFFSEKTSPLIESDRAKFAGLEYFAIDKNYAVKASLERFDSLQYSEIKHTLNRTYQFIKWGIAHFKLLNDSCHLTIYLTAEKESKNTMLFIPFKDATNGTETYGGGRYLDLEMPQVATTTIDFNFAYNPNCAYSDNWSCPLVPNENILKTSIWSGVKKFEREH